MKIENKLYDYYLQQYERNIRRATLHILPDNICISFTDEQIKTEHDAIKNEIVVSRTNRITSESYFTIVFVVVVVVLADAAATLVANC
jgi:hypothetical protein